MVVSIPVMVIAASSSVIVNPLEFLVMGSCSNEEESYCSPPLACLLVSSAYVGHVTSLAAVVRSKVPAVAFSEYSLEMAIWPVFRFTQPA